MRDTFFLIGQAREGDSFERIEKERCRGRGIRVKKRSQSDGSRKQERKR